RGIDLVKPLNVVQDRVQMVGDNRFEGGLYLKSSERGELFNIVF
ncbi:MAG: hypothetical protein RL326_2020, partial [Pseudomonadota bacterium]